jgi:hypothetical protein
MDLVEGWRYKKSRARPHPGAPPTSSRNLAADLRYARDPQNPALEPLYAAAELSKEIWSLLKIRTQLYNKNPYEG